MTRYRQDLLSLMAVFALLMGCQSQPSQAPPANASGAAGAASAAEEPLEGLTLLDDSEREAALAQRVCPVSGAPLGSMGKPPLVSVQGKEVFLCCAGCETELRSNPEKYLAGNQPQ